MKNYGNMMKQYNLNETTETIWTKNNRQREWNHSLFYCVSCVSILRVLASSYQNVVSIISILHLFCRHKHNLYRVNKKRPHNCNILQKMRAPVVRGKRKTSQFLRKHCCFLDWSSLGGRHVKLFIFHLDLESIWKIKLDIGAIWVEKEGLSCTLGSALLVCKTFSSLGPKTPYVLMDIGTLWTPSTLVCVASLGWEIAFFGCVEPFNFHDLKILGPSRY